MESIGSEPFIRTHLLEISLAMKEISFSPDIARSKIIQVPYRKNSMAFHKQATNPVSRETLWIWIHYGRPCYSQLSSFYVNFHPSAACDSDGMTLLFKANATRAWLWSVTVIEAVVTVQVLTNFYVQVSLKADYYRCYELSTDIQIIE